MEKINFSGGEPFLHDRGEYLGKLVKFCKTELQLPSVSIVSNGSLIRERWFQNYGVLHGMALSLLLLLLLVLVFPSILGLQPDLLRRTGREEKLILLTLIAFQAVHGIMAVLLP